MSTSVWSGVRSYLRQVVTNIPEIQGIDMAWEGRAFKPTIGKSYIREEVIPTDSPVSSWGPSGLTREDFLYQLSIFVPSESRMTDHEDLADAIRAVFYPGFPINNALVSASQGGTVIQADRTQSVIQTDFRLIVITISAYIYRPNVLS